jgi:ABC-type transporter MlaC component
MSNREMAPLPRTIARDGAPPARAALALVLALGWLAPEQAEATEPGQDSPEAAIRAAYTELGGLVWAPPSAERDDEIAQLMARDVDFEELTRRAFGEPCPRSGCTDHWAELSPAQREEVEPLFADVVTRQWTRELGKASGYDIDVQPAVTHARDARVRVFARPKGEPSKAPIVLDAFFLANHPRYRLVDIDVGGSRLARSYYKQFDRALTNPGEGYAYLVSRLRKKVDRRASARDGDADARTDSDDESDAAPLPDTPEPEPKMNPTVRSVPWLPIALGGAAAVAVGVWLGRRGRASSGAPRDGTTRR